MAVCLKYQKKRTWSQLKQLKLTDLGSVISMCTTFKAFGKVLEVDLVYAFMNTFVRFFVPEKFKHSTITVTDYLLSSRCWLVWEICCEQSSQSLFRVLTLSSWHERFISRDVCLSHADEAPLLLWVRVRQTGRGRLTGLDVQIKTLV